jgi:hypothetical protein
MVSHAKDGRFTVTLVISRRSLLHPLRPLLAITSQFKAKCTIISFSQQTSDSNKMTFLEQVRANRLNTGKTLLACLCMIAWAVSVTMIGPSILHFKDLLHASLDQITLLMPARASGHVIGTIVGNPQPSILNSAVPPLIPLSFTPESIIFSRVRSVVRGSSASYRCLHVNHECHICRHQLDAVTLPFPRTHVYQRQLQRISS